MRISTSQMYERGLSNLLTQQTRISKLQEQLSSGLRVQIPSDDPIAFAQIELMNQRLNMTELLQKNRQGAESILGIEEGILKDSITAVNRLKDIQVLAGNGAMSEDDRKSLAIEAQSLLNHLQDLANTKDTNGDYMFSGSQTTTQPFLLNASGQFIYQGDSTQRFQAITGSLQIPINDPGDGIFMQVPNGNGYFAIQQTAVPNIGTASVSTGSVINTSSFIPDNYTMSFATNSQGQLVVMVSGAASGNVIPPTGLPDDAPVYQDGFVVSFNGMEMTVNGAPQAGDSFSITPSKNESIFSTVQRMIANLSKPYTTASDKAATQTENNQLLAQLDSDLSNILNYQSSLGSRLNQLDSADDANSILMDICNQTLKQLREADPVQVATDYNMQLINLQAAQQSFVRIQGLSLFNYI